MWKRGFNETNDHPVFLERLGIMFAEQDLFDCKFLVGPEKVPFGAHKLILAMTSDAFRKLVYSVPDNEPIPLPNDEPQIFKLLLRYIYLNESPLDEIENQEVRKRDELYLKKSPLEDEKAIISLWVTTTRFQLEKLMKKYFDKIKINVSTCIYAYGKTLLLQKAGYRSPYICNIISRCEKLIAVKTPDILARIVDDKVPDYILKHLFAVEIMMLESELELFETLAKYAHAHGWKPSEQYYKKDKNGQENATFQKNIRNAIKKIGFSSMTLKEFDEGPSKSGFLTEEEVTMIRKKIANDNSLIYPIGFLRITTKRRYESVQQKEMKIIEVEDKDIEKLTFTIDEFPNVSKKPEESLWVTDSFLFSGFTWKILIHKNKSSYTHNFPLTVYLKCEGSTTPGWKCHAQLDVIFNRGKEDQVFENIPWFCFHSGFNYSQMKPKDLHITNKLKCHFVLSTSQLRVSYKNKYSNVSPTYGTNVRDYE